jgi:ankyrin repeat protein
MKENDNNINESYDSKYYNSLFNNIIKFIESNNSDISTKNNNNYQLLNEKISTKLDEINNKGIELILIMDTFNNTLIQYYLNKECNNTYDIIIIILNYYCTILSKNNKDKLYKWLLNDNSENFNIFELLIEKQYSLNLKMQIDLFNNLFNNFNYRDTSIIYQILNNRNNNPLHLCVKQNNIPLLLFLYEKFKYFFPSINVLDIKNNEGMTSLHLSCFYLYKSTTDALLLLGCNLDEKDNLGNTPLHYAVRGGNFGMAKKLILFGAKKNIRNNEYLSPKDLIGKSANFTMKKLFSKNIFNRISSIKDKRRENILVILILISLIIKLYFFIKKYKEKVDFIFCVTLFSFVFDMFCCGFIFYPKICNKKLYKKKTKNNNDYNLLNRQVKFEDIYKFNNYDLDKIERLCPVCKKIQQSKTKHCIICNKCIENWDHHCYWLNICINKETYNLFIVFLIILFIMIIFNIIFFSSIFVNIKVFKPLNYINMILFVIITGILLILFYGLFSLIRQFNQIKKNKKIDQQRILSLEDILSNSSSSSSSLSESLNKSIEMNYSSYKDINSSPEGTSSIEFQEINN